MNTLTGTPASAGVAIGPLVVIRPSPVVAGGRIAPEQADAEIARLAPAMEAAASELEALAERVGAEHPAEAEIFFAHAMLAGNRATQLHALVQNFSAGGMHLVRDSRLARVKHHQRMEIPIPGMKNVADFEVVFPGDVDDEAQHLRKIGL